MFFHPRTDLWYRTVLAPEIRRISGSSMANQNNSLDRQGSPFLMLNTYDFVDPAGVALLSLPDPGFGPEMNFHGG